MEKKSIVQEFKAFISRGNVVDMAVGVIIGSAFTKIVNSLVNDVFMPALSVVTGGVSFTDMKYVITPATEEVAEVAIKYGAFIQNVIDFLIIAFCVFMLVKFITKLTTKKKAEEPAAPPAPPAPSAEEKLLAEIRDLLKEKK